MPSKPFQTVKGDPKLLKNFSKIVKRKTAIDTDAIKTFEKLVLIKDGKLTIMDDIVNARILQTNKKHK